MTLQLKSKKIRGDEYLHDLARELNLPSQYNLAGKVLRWVLHSIRNENERIHSYRLLTHLPNYLRIVFVDHWQYDTEAAYEDDTTLFDLQKAFKEETYKFIPIYEIERLAINAVFKVIGKSINYKNFEEIYNYLPERYKRILIEDAFPVNR